MDRATHPGYLLYQYGTTEKLDSRIEAHQRYSERPDDYLDWVLDRLDPHPGDVALDVPAVSIEGNAERLPMPDAPYDLSMANHVLFLIADQRAALRELRRVLSHPGAWC